jgi:DNA-binding transcriptional ArsR family regulator
VSAQLAVLPGYTDVSRVAHALANGGRLQIVDLLAQVERSVESLAAETGLSVANASRHLQVLRQAHLVETRREGHYIYYRLADPHVFSLVQSLRQLANRSPPVLHATPSTATPARPESMIDRESLAERVRWGEIVVLDVRPAPEYAAGHIASARSVPSDNNTIALAAWAERASRDREAAVYSRGPYCELAIRACNFLRDRGLRVARFAEGFPDWKAAGLPIEESA